jgi:hypothetical protein
VDNGENLSGCVESPLVARSDDDFITALEKRDGKVVQLLSNKSTKLIDKKPNQFNGNQSDASEKTRNSQSPTTLSVSGDRRAGRIVGVRGSRRPDRPRWGRITPATPRRRRRNHPPSSSSRSPGGNLMPAAAAS